jgi:hypothetical protein
MSTPSIGVLVTRRERTRATVHFRGIRYDMDIDVCRRALVRCQVAGDLDSLQALAEATGRSRSTASRFFAGRPVSLAVALAVLDRLNLQFNDVFAEDGTRG